MRNSVRRMAQIVLSALLTAGLSGCGNKCEKLRDACNKCTDPDVRSACLDTANEFEAGYGASPGVSGNDMCSLLIGNINATCR